MSKVTTTRTDADFDVEDDMADVIERYHEGGCIIGNIDTVVETVVNTPITDTAGISIGQHVDEMLMSLTADDRTTVKSITVTLKE